MIAVRPLPELSHLVRAWGTVLVGVALVPVGWTILFATAGALSLDATSFGAVGQTGLVGSLTAHVAGAFAALLTFFLAVKLPLGVLGHLRGALGGIGGPAHAAGGAAQAVRECHASATPTLACAPARCRRDASRDSRPALSAHPRADRSVRVCEPPEGCAHR